MVYARGAALEMSIWMSAAFHRLSRRGFIQASAAAGAAALLPGCATSSDKTAVVIGSGFGGAVAALRLGQAGVRTRVLERGQRWVVDPAGGTFSPNLPPDRRSTWMRTESIAPIGPTYAFSEYTGVLDRIDLDGMQIYAGSAVGGGSLVYGGMTVAPSREVFQSTFGGLVDFDEMEQVYFPRVRSMLDVRTVPDDVLDSEIYRIARLAIEHTEKAGFEYQLIDQATDWDVIRAEISGEAPPSAIEGELLYGANSGYKNSLDKNYLPAAEATGNVSIHPLHQVERIAATGKGYLVYVSELTPEGEVAAARTLPCDMLFIAAGSVHTSRLLVEARARGDLPNLDPSVGSQWGANGNTMFMRSELDEETGVQGGPPVLAVLDYDNEFAPMVVEQAPFPVGSSCGCMMHLAVAGDPRRGEFVYDPETDRAEVRWPGDGHSPAVVRGVEQHLARMIEANGGVMGHPWLPEPSRHFSYHPSGGVPMPTAVDSFGRVQGYDDLYVVDGALLPGTASAVNPSLQIAALAERAMDEIVRNAAS